MNADRRKQLKDDYKSKPALGGVYAIDCSGNGRRYIKSTVDIGGIKNRFSFAQATKGSPDPALRREWTEYGSDSFSLVVLEELEMKEGQTAREFADEIELLRDMWAEKSSQNEPERGGD